MKNKSQNLAFNDVSNPQNPGASYAPILPLQQKHQAPANDDNDTLMGDDTDTDRSDSMSECYEDELTGEPVEFYATPEQIAAIQSQTTMKSALKVSGTVLLFAFIAIFLLWYRLVFELDSTSTWQTVVILIIALVQSSIFANTLIVLASVIHGKLGGQLQILITPTTNNRTCRESLLFSDALCQGSYKASLGVIVAMGLAMAYHYNKVPMVFDTVTVVTLAVFMVANLLSIIVIKATHNKVRAALVICKKED